jgi:membrane-associated phospholipid phosphatase
MNFRNLLPVGFLLTSALLLVVYTLLAVFYKRLGRVNIAARLTVHRLRRPWMRSFFIFTHKLYDVPAASVQISGVALLLAFVWNDGRAATALLVSLFLQTAVVSATKTMSGRLRPPHDTAHVIMRSGSYPSGHTAGSLTFAILAPSLIFPHVPPVVAYVIAAYLLVMATLTAVGRLYLDMHWFTDIVGGWLLSAVALMFTLALLS